MEPKYIDFNIDDIRELQNDYLATLTFLREELPEVDWESRIEVKDYFKDEFGIKLKNVKISHLTDHIPFCEEDSEARWVLESLIAYMKVKYEIRNYTNCILRHHVEGRLHLREINGQWFMPNRQPIVYSPNIKECITGTNVPELVQITH